MPFYIMNNGPHIPDWVIAFLTIGIFVAAAWQTRIFHRQTTLLENQQKLLHQANELERADKRAWVGVPQVLEPNWTQTGSQPVALAVFENTGHSPALKVRSTVGCIFKPPGEDLTSADVADLDMSAPGSTVSIPPDGKTCAAIHLAKPLSAHQVTEVQSKRLTPYVFGRIEYEDVFGNQHRTTFARFIHPLAEPWLYASIHNDMD